MAGKLCLLGTAGVVMKLMGGGVVVLNLSLFCLESPRENTRISSSEQSL